MRMVVVRLLDLGLLGFLSDGRLSLQAAFLRSIWLLILQSSTKEAVHMLACFKVRQSEGFCCFVT